MSEYKFQQPGNEDSKLVPFGKYKGQPIESMLADRDYLDWVIAQPGIVSMLQVKFPALFNIISVGTPTLDDSPEHNKLQAKFLDKAFQYAFVELLNGKSVQSILEDELLQRNAELLEEWKEERKKILEDGRRKLERVLFLKKSLFEGRNWYSEADLQKGIADLEQLIKNEELSRHPPPQITELPVKIVLNFECGFDVAIGIRVHHYRKEWSVEIKPMLGDDFPSVLRQIKRNEATVVLIGTFQSTACTFDQVKAIFAAAGAKIVTFNEIERIKRS
jgi:hypothetical protein